MTGTEHKIEHKKTAIILSGAGLLSTGGIALKQFFEKHQLRADVLIGCSGGSIIAGLWAMGYRSEQMIDIIKHNLSAFKHKKPKIKTFLTFFYKPFGTFDKRESLLSPKDYQSFLKNLFENRRIESLRTKVIFQTTDFVKGESANIQSGLLWRAVYASSAMMPFYPPIEINGAWHADGSFSMPLPISPSLIQSSEIVIASNCSATSDEAPTNFMDFFSSFVYKAGLQSQKAQHSFSISLHTGEIYIIDIKIKGIHGNASLAECEKILSEAQVAIAKKEHHLLHILRSAV